MVFPHNVEFPIFHNVGWLSSMEKPKPSTGAVLCKQRMMFVSRGINIILFLACNQKCTVATILACHGPPALLLSISLLCALSLSCVFWLCLNQTRLHIVPVHLTLTITPVAHLLISSVSSLAKGKTSFTS